jgi:ribonucleotide reductase beta subunit family protein with ferritin-like domain
MKNTNIFKPVEGWTVEYQQFIDLVEKAQSVFWMSSELHVESDINKFLTVATPAQQHAMNTIAQVFVQQELSVGNYWVDVIYKTFQRPEIRDMALYFAMTEQSIHAPFYAKLPQALRLDADPEFYSSYHDVPEFEDRLRVVGESVKSKDILLSIATFAIIEKVTLFTQFAVIKSFNIAPFNLFSKVADGINFSAIDENYHGEGGILLYNLVLKEQGAPLAEATYDAIRKAAYSLLEHEYALLDMIYAKGEIGTVTKEQLKQFLHHRFNDVMLDLGFNEISLPVGDNPIATWFYKGVNNKATSSDTFTALSNTYNRKWQAGNFEWEVDK